MLATTTTERLFILSRFMDKDIDEVQIHARQNFVFLFEPSFWWFKKRYRMTLVKFEYILNTSHLTQEEVLFCKGLDEVGLK